MAAEDTTAFLQGTLGFAEEGMELPAELEKEAKPSRGKDGGGADESALSDVASGADTAGNSPWLLSAHPGAD